MICFQSIGSFNSLSSRYKHALFLSLADMCEQLVGQDLDAQTWFVGWGELAAAWIAAPM
jgi:hypothetical protein